LFSLCILCPQPAVCAPLLSPARPAGQSGRPLPRALNPVPKGSKSAATVALSKDASPEATKSQSCSTFSDCLAYDHPDAEYWTPFDNTASRQLIHYFDSKALPTNDAMAFFNALQLARPHFVCSPLLWCLVRFLNPFYRSITTRPFLNLLSRSNSSYTPSTKWPPPSRPSSRSHSWA
jgi:hypothetical protein